MKNLHHYISEDFDQFKDNVLPLDVYSFMVYIRPLRRGPPVNPFNGDIKSNLVCMGSYKDVAERAFDTFKNLRSGIQPQNLEDILGVLLVANSMKKAFPGQFGDDGLFLREIGRWREHAVKANDRGLFDEIAKRAWGYSNLMGGVFSWSFHNINEELRGLISCALGKYREYGSGKSGLLPPPTDGSQFVIDCVV